MLRWFLAFLALVLAFVPASRAEERILSFDSRIEVEKSGVLRVTETIEVWAEGNKIKRGIFRDLPTDRKGKDGLRSAKRFKVVSVKRDGKRENFQRERIENGIRIRIGNAEKKLRTGRAYTYEILYLTDRQLYLEEGRDALYWNVNGTEWGFPAEKVSATVILPPGIKGTKVWGYTGKLGERGKDYRAELTETGGTIEATRPFRPRENLTVMLEWPPGLLDERAYEDERVLSFDTSIKVEKNGDLLVTERIEARVEGKLLRTLPRQTDVRWGLKSARPLQVERVAVNGKEVDFAARSSTASMTVSTVDSMEWGIHTVEITYRTGRQLILGKDREGLEWELDHEVGWEGFGWGGQLPVSKASAVVELPAGIEPSLGRRVPGIEAEPTPHGAKFLVSPVMNRRFSPTLSLHWPPGLLAPAAYEGESFAEAHPGVVVSLALCAAALLYYLLAWVMVGKDPEKGVIIPRFDPPPGYSPGALRYLRRMKYDQTCMTAGLLGVAAKGKVSIEEQGGAYTVRPGNGKPPPLPSAGPPPLAFALTPDERALRNQLVGSGKVTLEKSNWVRIKKARKAHQRKISLKVGKTHFLRNLRWWIPGLALSLLGILCLCAAVGALFETIAGLVVGVPFGLLGLRLWAQTRAISVLLGALLGAPFGVFAVIFFLIFSQGTGPWPAMGMLYVGTLNLVFLHLIKAPTALGRKVLDHVDGFAHYLSVAEEERLNLENPPEKTPELFERFLPYALALGCEQQWAEKFDSVLRAAGQSPGRSGWSPSYYSGSVSGLGSSFAASMSSSLSSSLASSSSAPSSGGGSSGGGGFSGGGGGGGGGGGW